MAGFGMGSPGMPGLMDNGLDMSRFGGLGMDLLGQVGRDNPRVIADALAARGIQPPAGGVPGVVGPDMGMSEGLGSSMMPMGPSAAGGTPFPEGVTGAMGGDPTGGSIMEAPGAMGANPIAGLAGLGSMVGQKAQNSPAPIFSGGVSGSQKAPDLAQGAGSGPSGMNLMQILQQMQQGAQTPIKPLGTYI